MDPYTPFPEGGWCPGQSLFTASIRARGQASHTECPDTHRTFLEVPHFCGGYIESVCNFYQWIRSPTCSRRRSLLGTEGNNLVLQQPWEFIITIATTRSSFFGGNGRPAVNIIPYCIRHSTQRKTVEPISPILRLMDRVVCMFKNYKPFFSPVFPEGGDWCLWHL